MKFYRFLVLGIIIVFFLQNQAIGADSLKIGVLDMETLQQRSRAFKQVRDKLKKRFDMLRKKLQAEEA